MTKVQRDGTGAASNPGPAFTREWAVWLGTNALGGLSGQQLLDAMVEAGFDDQVVIPYINEALAHPFLEAAARLGVGTVGETFSGDVAPSSRGEKLAWFLDNQRRLASLSATSGTVPRIATPSREAFLEQYYALNRPVLITGAIDEWPALGTWTGDYLKATCGDQDVEVQANRTTDDDYESKWKQFRKHMPFREIVDIIESGVETNDWYLTANNSGQNRTALRALWDDIRPLEYLDPNHVNGDGFFWYGPAGTVTPFHHDLTNGFMAQVRGSKRVKLVDPANSADVYNDNSFFSPVDLENIDLDRFPAMANVEVIDVDLHPGEVLFIPVGWWHHVRALEPSITMTFTNFVFENDFTSTYASYGEIS